MRLRTSSQQHQQKKLVSTETEVQPKIESDNQNVDSQTSSEKSGICYWFVYFFK
jgi:surface antigen